MSGESDTTNAEKTRKKKTKNQNYECAIHALGDLYSEELKLFSFSASP